MPNSYNLPGTPVVVGASPERRIQISGSGDIEVDGKKLTDPVVVDKAVFVTGQGFVVTKEVEAEEQAGQPNKAPEPVAEEKPAPKAAKKAPRKPRPSEIKAKAQKKKGK